MQSTQVVKGVTATELLREDHRQLQDLFSLFESETDFREKRTIGQRAVRELEVHSLLEEKLFYPAARRILDDKQLVVDSEEAHHTAKGLCAELTRTPFGERYNGKFRVLMETVRDHIAREEEVFLPKMERSGIDLRRLGSQMEALRYKSLTSAFMGSRNVGRNILIFGIIAAAAAAIAGAVRSQRS